MKGKQHYCSLFVSTINKNDENSVKCGFWNWIRCLFWFQAEDIWGISVFT